MKSYLGFLPAPELARRDTASWLQRWQMPNQLDDKLLNVKAAVEF